MASLPALRARAAALADIRAFFAARDVLEVQTPLLGPAPVTDADVENIAVGDAGFLQTSPEYFLKRLLAAGVPCCYQLAAAFRADERGRLHNPEFTLLEWYRLDFDHRQLMAEVADLCDLLLGAGDYRQITYADLLGEQALVHAEDRAALDLVFAEACAALRGRVFVVDYPAGQAALARLNPDGTTAARFELVIDGVEVANGYWELLDAAEHQRRFASDLQVRAQRGLPARQIDSAFMAALQAGLPPCAGVALGVDRLLMLMLGADSLDAVLAFR